MDISDNYGFYLPSRDGDDIADINQISDNFRKIDTELSEMIKGKGVDQTYDPTSKNPQSGTAVADAVENFISREEETEWIFDGGDASGSIKIINPVDSEMSDTSDNAVQNKVVKKYVDDRSIDYIVEQGTDGIWTYRKWESGVAECFGSFTEAMTITEPYFATQHYHLTKEIDLMSDLFVDAPSCVTVTPHGTGWFYFVITKKMKDKLEGMVNSLGVAVTNTNVTFQIHAVGRWK